MIVNYELAFYKISLNNHFINAEKINQDNMLI